MKHPLKYCKTYQFLGGDEFDYSHPLRAMAQWVERHPEAQVLAVAVELVDVRVVVTLTVEIVCD